MSNIKKSSDFCSKKTKICIYRLKSPDTQYKFIALITYLMSFKKKIDAKIYILFLFKGLAKC